MSEESKTVVHHKRRADGGDCCEVLPWATAVLYSSQLSDDEVHCDACEYRLGLLLHGWVEDDFLMHAFINEIPVCTLADDFIERIKKLPGRDATYVWYRPGTNPTPVWHRPGANPTPIEVYCSECSEIVANLERVEGYRSLGTLYSSESSEETPEAPDVSHIRRTSDGEHLCRLGENAEIEEVQIKLDNKPLCFACKLVFRYHSSNEV